MHVSVIVPIHNGSKWIKRCFDSFVKQTALGCLDIEVCVCNDASTDDTEELLQSYDCQLNIHVFNNTSGQPLGVGYAKNRAVSLSSGDYLCFQDVDDEMLPDRILSQYNFATSKSNDSLIGSCFKREPDNSTERYTYWANNLHEEELNYQVYTSHGPTIIMPTWFCHRSVFDRVGGFSEEGKGTPEDLIFFYKHLDLGGKIYRVDECLLIYTFHQEAATFTIDEKTIWKLRIERLERKVLSTWQKFTIWNAGKQGRRFYNSLREENQKKVINLCDVDVKKIGKTFNPFNVETRTAGRPIEIVHFKKASPPFVICVKLGLTNGSFEENLKSLNLRENYDYILFS